MLLTTVKAWGTERVDLPAGVAHAVAAGGLVRVELERPPDEWRLIADSRVGVAMGENWEIRVVPRLAIPKLIFLLGYASDPNGWRELTARMAHEDELFRAVASGFATHAWRAIETGVLRGYLSTDESATVIRGRIRIGDQLARRPGVLLPVEIRYDDYTTDIPENRLLAAASTLLLRLPHLPELTRAQLRRVRATLGQVGAPRSHEAPPVTRLNRRYAAALKLAALILKRLSISTDRGRIVSTAFVFDMNKVFEDFLAVALTEGLRPYGGRTQLQLTGHYLDAERRLPVRPDITWRKARTIAAVIDAKYKPITDGAFPNADAYQMLAYCQAFRLNDGTLVYAKGEAREQIHTLPTGIKLRVAAIDVEREPAELLSQVDNLAASIARATKDHLSPQIPA
jgi:5-methylcytosine-specific restriction enzyme subunit McrC